MLAPRPSKCARSNVSDALTRTRLLRYRKAAQLGLIGAVVLTVILVFFPRGDVASAPSAQQQSHPPIPIRFHLDQPAYVTLVIDNDQGQRVRNLVSETPFPAGENTAWWDGLDDLGRDPNAAAQAKYRVPGTLVVPGNYTVRGLYRQKVDLRYEFAVYNPGQPPWTTSDTSSDWLANHTPPEAVCFISAGSVAAHGKLDAASPAQVLIGSHVTEGGSGLAWVDLNGRKLHGQVWTGGVWSGAEEIASDLGPRSLPGVYAYIAASWGELRLRKLVNKQRATTAPRDRRFGSGEDLPVLDPAWKFPSSELEAIAGLAAYNGLVVVSLPKMNELLFVDAEHSRVAGSANISLPKGLFADGKGSLYIISEKKVLKATLPDQVGTDQKVNLGTPQVFIAEGLEDPQELTMDAASNLYVSDRGASNQVKVFSPSGKLIRTIGSPGIAVAGPYDPKLMHNPKGITIDDRGQLWVAEEDFQPKRVSVWDQKGEFLRAFYGPPTYGGGGNLDPRYKSLFYVDGMTFHIDWSTGKSSLIRIQYRPKVGEPLIVPKTSPAEKIAVWQEKGSRNKKFGASERPDLPIYFGTHKYFTNAYNTNPVGGTPVVGIWIEKNGAAVPVAAFGNAAWWQLLESPPFHSHIVASAGRQADPRKPLDLSAYTFVWSDLNGNGTPDPPEVTVALGRAGNATVSNNLEFVTDTGLSYKPSSISAGGTPIYDLNEPRVLATETQKPISSGGGQVLASQGTWTILTTAPKPFAPQSIGGAEKGRPKWSYPSLWPGLHASHNAPQPEFPGELIGTTRLLGPSFQLQGVKDVELWAINGNKGNIYLFTTDGLLVATLFKDSRLPTSSWAKRTTAQRGMDVSDLTAGEENFWPSITQTQDGKVYVVTNDSSVIRVDGLDTIRRIPQQTIFVTPYMLAKADLYLESAHISRQGGTSSSAALTVPIGSSPMRMDGDLAEWDPKQFVMVDQNPKPSDDGHPKAQRAEAAMRVGGGRLYLAFKTGDPQALNNSGVSPQNLFKTGGGLDLMIATNASADSQRKTATAGDVRLLAAIVKGKPLAMLYRPVAADGAKRIARFESPLQTLTFDDVEDVSQYVQLKQGTKAGSEGDFELSIPLEILGLKPTSGETVRGDIGLLRGDGLRTTQRVYWSNKETGVVSDIPSEAALAPQYWGTIKFVAASGSQR
jgi:hypothetical protein